jgi:hypothetical protein
MDRYLPSILSRLIQHNQWPHIRSWLLPHPPRGRLVPHRIRPNDEQPGY